MAKSESKETSDKLWWESYDLEGRSTPKDKASK